MLTSHLTQENFARSLGQLEDICMRMEPALICSVLNNLAGGAGYEDLEELFISLLGGLDLRYRNGMTQACSDQDCNAASVCLLFGTRAAGIGVRL